MTTQSKQLHNRIMRRVYGIWFMRRVLPMFCVELFVFSAILFSVQSYLSFGKVMENMVFRATNYSLMNFGNYWVNALVQTELITKVLLFGAVGVGFLIMRDTFRISYRFQRNFLRFSRVIS